MTDNWEYLYFFHYPKDDVISLEALVPSLTYLRSGHEDTLTAPGWIDVLMHAGTRGWELVTVWSQLSFTAGMSTRSKPHLIGGGSDAETDGALVHFQSAVFKRRRVPSDQQDEEFRYWSGLSQ